MNTSYTTFATHGFTISSIHGKRLSMLTATDFSSLQQCDTLEDIVVKLSSTYYRTHVTESLILTAKHFKTCLSTSITKEFDNLYKNSSGETRILLDYFLTKYKMANFVYLLACKKDDPTLERAFKRIQPLDHFNELDTLKFSNDMADVYKFCVEHTFLNKYWKRMSVENEIGSNDFQSVQACLNKLLIEDFYSAICEIECMAFMKSILAAEGDRWIVEIVLNTIGSDTVGKRRTLLFPSVCSIDLGMRQKLSVCESVDELRGIVSGHGALRRIITVEDCEIVNVLVEMEMEKYGQSFGVFNDISCVYGYLKMKEQEIKNILWTVECIALKKKDFMKNIIVPKEHPE